MYNNLMMLKVRLNHGYYHLGERSGGSVNIRLRSGGSKSFTWLGFIDSEVARQIEGAIPVKIEASYYCDDSIGFKWHEIKEGSFAQGCAVDGLGVYGVYNASVRVVSESDVVRPDKKSTTLRSHWPSETGVRERGIYGGKRGS